MHHNVTICSRTRYSRSTSTRNSAFFFFVRDTVGLHPTRPWPKTRGSTLRRRVVGAKRLGHTLFGHLLPSKARIAVACSRSTRSHNRVPLPAPRLGQSQQRRLRGLVGHVYDDASIRAEEGRGEVQRVSGTCSSSVVVVVVVADAGTVETMTLGGGPARTSRRACRAARVRVRDRMDEFFGSASAVEQ